MSISCVFDVFFAVLDFCSIFTIVQVCLRIILNTKFLTNSDLIFQLVTCFTTISNILWTQPGIASAIPPSSIRKPQWLFIAYEAFLLHLFEAGCSYMKHFSRGHGGVIRHSINNYICKHYDRHAPTVWVSKNSEHPAYASPRSGVSCIFSSNFV